MPTTRLEIEYDGSGFRGWAAQPGQRTLQGELESALATILRRQVGLTVAGRTDAGVHAWGQVASFESESEAPADLQRRLNGVLPEDVVVSAAAPAPDGFDARRDARSRTYCYRVLARSAPNPFERGRSLWVPQPLDREALDRCAEALLGSHDFTAFTPTDNDHVHFQRKVLRSEWIEETAENPPMPASGQGRITGRPSDDLAEDMGGVVCFWIEGEAFMHNMVRALVGTMLEAAAGERSADAFTALLNGGQRREAGETVSPHGLYLASVRYS